jgi:hypothetical protein
MEAQTAALSEQDFLQGSGHANGCREELKKKKGENGQEMGD